MLEVFNVRQLQDTKALLEVFSKAGVTDVNAVVRELGRVVSTRVAKPRVLIIKLCPDCSRRMVIKMVDNVKYYACTCRYSEVIK